ncbi:26S proteasome non-ATPase regulatory subunit 9 [Rhagoletis pomonella]|uniref:26S proteasome non-ATPase regulatory subunit 9 n=1 Tax=Rhagoletis pomonella TaxID=28610 RepID=UPI00178030F1|nr:26S proteasome non-ATPase regulatory subunit 9 [Rhagoletis pomonella]
MVVPMPNPTKDLVLKLMGEKEKLESRISEYGVILRNNDDVGMHGTLVDADGFPRNDIDVFQVRQARQQIICLQNDHKALMKEIEKQMHKLHAEAAEERAQGLSHKASGMHLEDDSEMSNTSNGSCASSTALAIAKVNMINPGSPAEEAGLKVGDELLEFGTINCRNFQKDLIQFGIIVRHMQNQRIPLKIKRGNQHLELILIPKTWSGRGLLGCNIVLPDV